MFNRRSTDVSPRSIGHRIGRAIVLLAVALAIGFLFESRAEATDPKPGLTPMSVLTITQCGKWVGVVVVMSNYEFYPLPLENLSVDRIKEILKQFPDSIKRKLNADVNCAAHTEL